MSSADKLAESLKRVDAKTEDLIYEFHAHYQSHIEEHPNDKNRKDEKNWGSPIKGLVKRKNTPLIKKNQFLIDIDGFLKSPCSWVSF